MLTSDIHALMIEADNFANGPYAAALRKGNTLSDAECKEMAKQVAKYSGLSEEYVLKSDLRIEAGKFRGELLRRPAKSSAVLILASRRRPAKEARGAAAIRATS